MTDNDRGTARGDALWRRAARSAALLLAPALQLAGCGSERPEILTVIKGSLPLYHTQGTDVRNDVSGATYLPGLDAVILVDDGGADPPDTMPLYRMDPDGNFRLTPLADNIAAAHLGLEGTTFDGEFAYVTSAMPSPTVVDATGTPLADPTLADDRLRNLTRFRFDGEHAKDVTTVSPFSAIVDKLGAQDPVWWNAVSHLGPKAGGLNVEGLAATPKGKLLFGLRAPHLGPDYPTVTENGVAVTRLRSGDAVVLEAGFDEQDPEAWVLYTLDLGGLGIRSIEYSPTARGYFITAGIVETVENIADDPDDSNPDFGLYFWKGPENEALPVKLDATCDASDPTCTGITEFAGLCRPEAVAEIVVQGKKYLFVGSEESGNHCAEPVRPYNFLLIELNGPFLDTLK